MGELPNGNRGAFSLLCHIFVLVIFTNSQILSQGFALLDLKQGDFVAGGQTLNQLNVGSIGAVLGKDYIFSLNLLILILDSLAHLMKTLSEERVSIAGLDDPLQSSIKVSSFGGHWWLKNI